MTGIKITPLLISILNAGRLIRAAAKSIAIAMLATTTLLTMTLGLSTAAHALNAHSMAMNAAALASDRLPTHSHSNATAMQARATHAAKASALTARSNPPRLEGQASHAPRYMTSHATSRATAATTTMPTHPGQHDRLHANGSAHLWLSAHIIAKVLYRPPGGSAGKRGPETLLTTTFCSISISAKNPLFSGGFRGSKIALAYNKEETLPRNCGFGRRSTSTFRVLVATGISPATSTCAKPAFRKWRLEQW